MTTTASDRQPATASADRQGSPGDFASPTARTASPGPGETASATASRPPGVFGWGDRQRHAGIGDRQAVERQAELADEDDSAGDDTARADIVLADDAEEEARLAKEGLQFRNLPFGTLGQILDYAWTAAFNFSHIPIVRAMSVVFHYAFTVPVLTVMWSIAWVYFLRFHRAVWTWPTTFGIAIFLNRVADWLVPDVVDPLAWSTTTRMVVAGGAFLFLVATLLVLKFGPEKRWERAS